MKYCVEIHSPYNPMCIVHFQTQDLHQNSTGTVHIMDGSLFFSHYFIFRDPIPVGPTEARG